MISSRGECILRHEVLNVILIQIRFKADQVLVEYIPKERAEVKILS